jgi:YD repeat-containing protein
MVQNYVDGTTAETDLDQDQIDAYEYLSIGQLKLVKNHSAEGLGSGVQPQDTKYLYKSLVDRSWVTNVNFPNSSDTTSSETDQVKYVYDPLGRAAQIVDQRGPDHRYDFDSAGRLCRDRIVNSVSGVDLSAKRIELAFNDLGRVQTISSYGVDSGGNVVRRFSTRTTAGD